MINRVSGPSTVREQSLEAFLPRSSVPEYCSTIRYGKKGSPKFWESIKNFISMLWSWVKYNIFFCIFDEEKEKQEQITKLLEEYIGVYFEEDLILSERGRGRLVKAYKALDSKIREAVEESIVEILREAKPDIKEQKVKAVLKQILANPFLKIKDKTKLEHEQEIQIFGDALIRANGKLGGYSKE